MISGCRPDMRTPKQIGGSALRAEEGRPKQDTESPAPGCLTWMGTPPAEHQLNPRAVCRLATSIIVEDGGEATALREQGVAAVPEQVEVERLVGLPLAVALDLDGDGCRRLAGGE